MMLFVPLVKVRAAAPTDHERCRKPPVSRSECGQCPAQPEDAAPSSQDLILAFFGQLTNNAPESVPTAMMEESRPKPLRIRSGRRSRPWQR